MRQRPRLRRSAEGKTFLSRRWHRVWRERAGAQQRRAGACALEKSSPWRVRQAGEPGRRNMRSW